MVNSDTGQLAGLVFNHVEYIVTQPQRPLFPLTYLVSELLMLGKRQTEAVLTIRT